MVDIREFYTHMKLSEEANEDYKKNIEFEYAEVSNVWMYICALTPMFSGMIDNSILNKIGCYSITWFHLLILLSMAICVYDYKRLSKSGYAVEKLGFFAVFCAPLYIYFRGKTVGCGSWICWLWIGLLMFVSIMPPM